MATRKLNITIEFEDSDFIESRLKSVVYGTFGHDTIISVSKPQQDNEQ